MIRALAFGAIPDVLDVRGGQCLISDVFLHWPLTSRSRAGRRDAPSPSRSGRWMPGGKLSRVEVSAGGARGDADPVQHRRAAIAIFVDVEAVRRPAEESCSIEHGMS